MGRWEPDARGRLERAAVELYLERGFDRTTVAEIAERAGLTKRSFFRHYDDKRDVLFAGAAALQALVVGAVATAPADAPPLTAVGAGLRAAAPLLAERGSDVRARQAVIDANPELQERELIKMARLAGAVAATLRGRGSDARTAALAAEAGIAVFRIAFAEWVVEPGHRDLVDLIDRGLDQLREVTG